MVPPASRQVPRVRRYSGYCLLLVAFTYGTITLSGLASQPILLAMCMDYTVRNPGGITTSGLASFHFARRYFGNRCFFLFLRLLRCFSSAGIPSLCYFIHITMTEYCSAVFPHSEICGSIGYLLLTAAYRSLSRPSSAPDAKAFTLHSY